MSSVTITVDRDDPVDPLLLGTAAAEAAGLEVSDEDSFFLQALISKIVVIMRTNIRMRIMATATAIKYSNFS